MAEWPLRILQVSTTDIGGGAERVAWNLFQVYRARGYGSWLAVGRRRSDDPGVFAVPNDDCCSRWARIWFATGNMLSPLVGKVRGAGRLRNWSHRVGQLRRLLRAKLGYEDFEWPGTWRLLSLLAQPPDIVHCHNLHGSIVPEARYFDLRAFPWLSRQVPVVLTLHDAWLLSGHCAHSFACERWKIGCGSCPDITIYPAIRRDATHRNWLRKQRIYAKSRLFVATPCRWLMEKVEQSMLGPAVVEARVIAHGVDLTVFHPADSNTARAALGISRGSKVLLFAAKGIRRSIWKDYRTLRCAVALVAERLRDQDVLLIALGEDSPVERIGRAEVRFVPFQEDPQTVARYYQAADVYVHAARTDTFPNTVLEALACGTPAVATDVGGIPEQIGDGETGFLVAARDARAMAARVEELLRNNELLERMSRKAADCARKRFGLDRMTDGYLQWYQEIMNSKSHALSEPD